MYCNRPHVSKQSLPRVEVLPAHHAVGVARWRIKQLHLPLWFLNATARGTRIFLSAASPLLRRGNSNSNCHPLISFLHRGSVGGSISTLRRLLAELLFLSGGGRVLRVLVVVVVVVVVVHGDGERDDQLLCCWLCEREQRLKQYYLCASLPHVLTL